MALSIKNPETEDLAHRLATATGESLTAAVTVALRERLARLQGSDEAAVGERADRLRGVSRDACARWKEPYGTAAHGDLLYDDAGLPR